MPACRACGASAPDDAKFCPTCGTYFPAPAAPGPATPPASPTGTPWAPVPVPGAPAVARPRPLGVTIMAMWDLVVGPLIALAGLIVAVVGPTLLNDPQFQQQVRQQLEGPVPTALLGDLVAVFGVLTVLLGVAMALVGYGMWHGRGWAWSGTMGITLLWAVLGVVSFPTGLVNLAIALFLLWYFTRDGVKAWFGKARPVEPGLPSYVPPPPPAPPT